MMRPETPLPIDASFANWEEYVESLLTFATSSELFQKLCGGVHILDFLTKEPDLYSTLLPAEWRDWFLLHGRSDILDLLLREDISALCGQSSSNNQLGGDEVPLWRGHPLPPNSLVEYIMTIRRHALQRDVATSTKSGMQDGIPRHIAVGMKPKKIHEVQRFAKYIDDLSAHVDASSPHSITHVVDFGSGQNYLGRALASPPYDMNVVALESKSLNITGAKTMDVTAKLVEKEKIIRNKKLYRQEMSGRASPSDGNNDSSVLVKPLETEELKSKDTENANSKVQYFEKFIHDGDLSDVMYQLRLSQDSNALAPQPMVVSLHSCGNLLHHGLRSLVLNSCVKAVAMVGCCYNLVTERLRPPTYKLPSLRSSNLRLASTSAACDPHGFPMSERLASYEHKHGKGIRMNITARMMAVQAPQNWTEADSESFFTRHFYRALLQRIFLDRGVVQRPMDIAQETAGGSPRGWTGLGPTITIGSLRKKCYTSFCAYVRGAVQKLQGDQYIRPLISERMEGLTDEEVISYERSYEEKKNELSITWSLMAFSATVVEAMIVIDRWLYLKEQPVVKNCWVEAVFDYKESPRNLVIVAIKE